MDADDQLVNKVYEAKIQGTTLEHLMYRLEEWLPHYAFDVRNSRPGRETFFPWYRADQGHNIIVDLIQATDNTVFLTVVVSTVTQPDQERKLIDRLNISLQGLYGAQLKLAKELEENAETSTQPAPEPTAPLPTPDTISEYMAGIGYAKYDDEWWNIFFDWVMAYRAHHGKKELSYERAAGITNGSYSTFMREMVKWEKRKGRERDSKS